MYTRFLILLILNISFFNINCAVNNKANIPNDVTVHVEMSPIPTPFPTMTVTVKHEIGLSFEMEQLFSDECAAQFNKDTQEYFACMNVKKSQFMNQLLEFLNNQPK